MPKYRVSDFCHSVMVSPDYWALYNSLTLGVMFVDRATNEMLDTAIGKIFDGNQLPQQTIEALQERRLIFPLGKRDDLTDYLKAQDLLRSNGVAILYLLLADGCNLACTYCYIEKVLPLDYIFTLMSKDTVERSLNLFAQNISKDIDEPKVVIYGGEPLLNKTAVHFAIDRFREMKKAGELPERTSLVINTNATLIDEEFLQLIAGKDVQIAVSLDGSKDMHDAMRKYKDGSGSYDQVIKNCKLMRAMGVNFGFSVTITKANIHHMEDLIRNIHEEFGMDSVGFNIAIHQSEEVIGMSKAEYAELISDKLISCFEICREKGIYEDRIMRKVNAFVAGYPYLYDCGAPGDQIVVSPGGMVGVCQAYCGDKRNFVPMDELGPIAENPIWSEWRYRSPLYQEQCYSCISLGICGGGCPYNAEIKTGSIWGIDESFCVHSKKTVHYLINDLFRQSAT